MMALPSTMTEKAAAYSNHQHELQQKQQQQREHLKSKSAKSNHAQWKQKLRTDCIARAQTARRKKIQQARRRDSDDPQHNIGVAASSTIASSMCYNSDVTSCRDVNKRGRENNNDSNDEYEQMVDHIPLDDYNDVHGLQKMSSGGVSDEGVLDTAKMLVEHELQRALTGLRHCEQMQQGAPSCKKSYQGSLEEDEEEYKISQEEFVALLAEVTEELQREEELLEEEMWELERADALERERLLHQIDDYDDWEELQQHQQHLRSANNVYTSPLLTNLKSRVTCPICNSASLTETPFEGIQCSNATTEKQCTFSLDIAHEGLTLNHLENQLRTVYEEHTNVCTKGILQFRVDSRGGITVLMASCDTCQADVVVL
ncbi:RPA-interacting protein C-terminal domain-containing protein [Skeletonema marinoi]|uniref:RPA-interacting protein C-terminal domain-containing protein n=1 Tax=Skeletonema marinoi TaxID=267567 RepID=A0AAD8Y231_9STRA|nr:RPA-interacting protein C-terminal domain-containing protein [Skeletonema marinoi]